LRLGLSSHGLVCPYKTVERKAYRHAAEEVKNIYDWLIKTDEKQNSLKVAS
jgi:chromosome partitioning protein